MSAQTGDGKGRSGGLAQPMSVEQIVQEAQKFEYNPEIPLKHWLRSAVTLLQEAEIYEQEGNDQQAYLLLFRHAQLVLKKLVKHPDAARNRAGLNQVNSNLQRTLEKMEVLRPRINARYERYQKLLNDKIVTGMNNNRKEPSRVPMNLPRPQEGQTEAVIAGPEPLKASENKDLAVKLAHKEIERRAAARKATRRAGIPEKVEQERRTAGEWGNWERDLASDNTGMEGDALSLQMQSVHLQVNERHKVASFQESHRPTIHSTRSTYNYPSIPVKSRQSDPGLSATTNPQWTEKGLVESMMVPPAPPPKDDLPVNLPPRPAKLAIEGQETMDSASIPASAKPPSDLELNPSSFVFEPAAYLENGESLRTVFLPPDLRHTFVQIAEKNTKANLETCGILCGTLISNAYFISKLVIPKQESTSDTCEMVNEHELSEYVISEGLRVLGWIHTHPTQTCFMSSRDLHTHSVYQQMSRESVAIVCAPSKNEWGVYRLTDPPGRNLVLTCKRSGVFHPHDSDNLYTDALRPGHVVEAKGLKFDVHDMRDINA